MKITKIKAIAAALLVSMSVSAFAIPSYARPIGDGLTLPEDGVVTYDFNTDDEQFIENKTDKNATETDIGTPNTVLEIDGTQNFVFQIGKGESNIYTPKHWETDYVKKSMSVRINNSGIKSSGNMSWQRIILWYEDETNWLGLDLKISDSKEAERADYTYDTRIVAMKSGLAGSASATSETVFAKWANLTYSGKKMLVGDRADWLCLDVTYAAKDKIELSLYKENNPDEKYVNANITTKSFDAYDIATATKVSDSSTYFSDYDLRKGLFGIAGVNYNTNVGYYDDLTVTLDVDSAKAINFKNDYADLFTLDADGLFNSFKTGSADYTATIARVKEAYAIYAAFSDTAKESLETEGAKLEDLLGVEKKASAYMGNDINIDFEDSLPASTYVDLMTNYIGTNPSNRQYLSVIANPSADSGNNSANVLSLAKDSDYGTRMIHKLKFTDAHATNYLNTVSFKMYYPTRNGSDGTAVRIYLNYNENAEIDKTDYLAFFSDGDDKPLQFFADSYKTDGSSSRFWSSAINVKETTDSIGTMQGQWYTVNMTYTATGVDVTVVNSNGQSSKVFSVPINGTADANSIAFGINNTSRNVYYDDFKVTFRSPYTMAMTNGAWLRDNDPTGIRFGAQNVAANELYGATDCTVVAAGALFMPYDKLEDGEQLTIERVDVKNANGAKALKAESRTDTMPKNIYGVLSNVIENDKIKKNRDFVCRTYIKYTKAGDPDGVYRYAYADADNAKMSRSLEYVVFAAAKDIAGYEGSVYDDAIKALKDAGKLGGNK